MMTPRQNKQQGFILITVMLLLGLISLSAKLAFDLSQLAYQSNHARWAQIEARHQSENARLEAVELLEAMLLHQAYSSREGLNTQLDVVDLVARTSTASSEKERYQKDGLLPFVQSTTQHGRSEVFIQAFPSQVMTAGTGLAQHMSYEREGLGVGNKASFSRSYELRSKGSAFLKGHELAFWTASDFRFIP